MVLEKLFSRFKKTEEPKSEEGNGMRRCRACNLLKPLEGGFSVHSRGGGGYYRVCTSCLRTSMSRLKIFVKTCAQCGEEKPPEGFKKGQLYNSAGRCMVCVSIVPRLYSKPKRNRRDTPQGEKQCSQCKETKLLGAFLTHHATADGYRYRCVACEYAEVPERKHCVRCRKTKPVDAFGRDRSDPGHGRQKYCVSCQTKTAREHLARRRESGPPQEPAEYKECRQCDAWLHKSKFGLNKVAYDGLQPSCKQCVSARQRNQVKRRLERIYGIPAPGFKICTRCKKEKELGFFPWRRGDLWTRGNPCVDCVAESRERQKKEYRETTNPSSLPGFKVCSRCKELKAFTDYHLAARTWDGLAPLCRLCKSKRRLERLGILDGVPVAPGHKRCARCRSVRAIETFPKNRNSHDGLHGMCWVCVREVTTKGRPRKKRNKEEAIAPLDI